MIICGRVRVSGKLFVRVIQPKLPKFVKVTAKILSVLFSGHGVLAGHVQLSYSINAVP